MWLDSVYVFLLFWLNVVCGFNLDTVNYARFAGEQHSMFGFSVATHKERGTGWVLVGAPNAQNQQPGVIRGGAVYRCRVDADDSCQEVPFDGKGHNERQGRYIDSKSNQWFGATLYSGGEDGPIVACAPRYVYFNIKLDRRDPVGTCYVSKGDFSSYSEYSPCRTAYFGYHRQGYCQAGFSAAVTKDGRRLFMGAPGSRYWQGQTFSIDAKATFPFTPGMFGGTYGLGQVVQQNLETRPSVVSTKSGTEREDNSYLGYSMAVGDFIGQGEDGVAVGMPRIDLVGKVVLYTWNLTNVQNITGLQLGEYFGYSIAAADVDGDHTDDLIIGAPMHTEPNNEEKYEVGRVYIVFQGSNRYDKFKSVNILDGFNSKSRFGLSLASLGDINLDGYGDFAVGAPYDGLEERGAVYVYHGGKKIEGSKFSQVIFAEDVAVGAPPMNTFGFSISGGLDLDENDYPDMAVGSYLSDTAFFFRSRPVVKIDSKVRFLTTNNEIILEEKNCTLRNRQPVSCTSVDFCIKFTGRGVPQRIDLEVQYILDTKNQKRPRMFFLAKENYNKLNESLELQKDSRHVCTQKIVYIKNDVRDKLTPLEVKVRYEMKESQRSFQHQHSRRDPRSALIPILDLYTNQFTKDSISVHKNCGPDNVCIPNLNIIAKPNVERYLLGSKEPLIFDVVVQNRGEDSFESTFDLRMPTGVNYNKIEVDKSEFGITCSLVENNTIHCDIGNPLPAYKTVQFKILTTPSHKEGMSASYNFSMFVNSSNPEPEETLEGNRKVITIPIWVDSKLEVGGISRPAELHYDISAYTAEKLVNETDIGPPVTHVYSIKNNGPSNINEAELVFLWPYATLGGDDLMYLLEQPHTLGNVKCEHVDANYRKLNLDYRKKSIWESLRIEGDGEVLGSAEGQSGVFIEEGKITYGSVGGESVHTTIDQEYEQNGDASLIHAQRGKKRPMDGGSSDSNKVLVTQDGGVQTHSRNTTHIGPDGKVTYTYESTSSSSSGGAAGGSSWSSSSGARPNIIYTSSGKQSSTNGTAFSLNEGQGSSSSSGGRTEYHWSSSSSQGGRTGGAIGGSSEHHHSSGSGSQDGRTSGGRTEHHYSSSSGSQGGVIGGRTEDHYGGSGGAQGGVSGGGMSGGRTEHHYSSSSGSQGGVIGERTEGAAQGAVSGTRTEHHYSSSSGSQGGAVGGKTEDHYGSSGGRTEHHYSSSSGSQGGVIGGRTEDHYGGSEGAAQGGRTEHHYSSSSGSQGGVIGGRTEEHYGGSEGAQGAASGGRTEHHYSSSGGTQGGGGAAEGGSGQTSYTHTTTWSRGGSNEQSGGTDLRGSGGRVTYNESSSHGGSTGHQDSYGGSRTGQHGGAYDESRTYEERRTETDGTDEHRYGHGGQTTHNQGQYPGNKPHSNVNTHFNWDASNRAREEDYYRQHGYYENRNQGQGTTATSHHQQGGHTSGTNDDTYSEEYYDGYDDESQENYGHKTVVSSDGRRYNHTTGTWSEATHHGSNYDESNYDQANRGGGLDLGVGGASNQGGLGGVVAHGQGFRTTALDLGIGGLGGSAGGGAQQSGSSYGGATHQSGSSYGGATHQSGSSYGGATHQSGSYGGATHQSGASGSSYGSGAHHSGSSGGRQWESRTETKWSSSGSGLPPNYDEHGRPIERDNVPTDRPNYDNKFVGRKKRQIATGTDIDIRKVMECKSTKCFTIRCTVGPLVKDQEALVALRSRVNVKTLRNISSSQPIEFSSMMVTRISKLPYIGTPLDRPIHSHEVFTKVPATEPDIKPEVIPLWVVVLSAVAGTVILILLIYLLYKCGFFKRNRPSDAPERQPLNRNGYYGQDAAL